MSTKISGVFKKNLFSILLLCLLVLGIFILRYNEPMWQSIKLAINEKIQEEIPYSIDWERVSVFPINQLVFHNISISDGEDQEPFFLGEKIIIRYRIWDLLNRHMDILKSIQEIVIDGFALELQNLASLESGGFDFSQEGFQGKVTLRRGQGTFSFLGGSQDSLTDISGYLDFQGGGLISVLLQGGLSSLKGSVIKAQGGISPSQIAIEVTFDKAQGQDLWTFLNENVPNLNIPLENRPEITQGNLNGQIKASGKSFRDLHYQGWLEIKKGSFSLPQIESGVSDLNAKIFLESQDIVIDSLQCKFLGANIAAKGLIDTQTTESSVEIKLSEVSIIEFLETLQCIAPQYIESWPDFDLSLEGQGDINLKLVGNWREPFIDCRGYFPKGSIQGNDYRDLIVDMRYQKNLLAVKELALGLGDGYLLANGSIRWFEGKPYYSFTTEILDLSSSLLPDALLPKDIVSSNKIKGSLFIAGYNFNMSETTVIGTLGFEGGSILGYPFQGAEAGFWLSKGELLLSPFMVNDEKGGTLKAQGTISLDGTVNFFVDALNIDISSYHADLKGLGEFRGQVLGTIAQPYLSGMVAGQGLAWQDKVLGEIKGRIALDLAGKECEFHDFKLKNPYGTALLYGNLNLKEGEPMISVAANVKGSSLAGIIDYISYQLPFSLDGRIEGDFKLTGALSALELAGELTLNGGYIAEQNIDTAKVCFNWQDGDISLESFNMGLGKGKVVGSGMISAAGGIDLTGVATDISFADIFYVKENLKDLTGKVDFKGKVTGTIDEPAVTGDIFAYDMAWENNYLGNLKGGLLLDKKEATFLDWVYLTSTGVYNLAGKIALNPEGELDLKLAVKNGSLQDVLPFLEFSKDWFGPIPFIADGEIQINGVNSNPYIAFTSLFRWFDGEAGAQGKGYLKGPYDMSLEGQGIDLAILHNFVDLPKTIEGRGDVSLIAKYQDVWNFSGTNHLKELKIEDILINEIVGAFYWEEGGIVRIDQEIKRKKDRLTIKGVIPLVPSVMGLDVFLEGQAIELDFLPFFNDRILYAHGEGDIAAVVSGSQLDPRLNGKIVFKELGFGYLDIPGGFSGIKGTISLAGNRINFDKISGYFNGTGRAEVEGFMLISGWEFSYFDLMIKGKKIPIKHGSVNGVFDGQFTVLGPYFTPHVRGEADFSNTTVYIPFDWPLEGDYEIEADIKPQVAITLRPHSNVKAVNENYEVLVQSGELQLDNNAGHYELIGEIQSRQGKINYYSTNFRLTEAKARFLRFAKSFPNLMFKAQTKVKDTTIYLAVDGPALDMKLQLSSVPFKDEKEIINLLMSRGGLGYFLEGDISGAIQGEFWRLMSETFHLSFLSQLEHSLEEILHLDEFSIMPFFHSGEQNVQLHLGKALTEDLYLTFMQSFFSDRYERQFGASLKLHKHIFLEGLYQGDDNFQIGVEFHFPFN